MIKTTLLLPLLLSIVGAVPMMNTWRKCLESTNSPIEQAGIFKPAYNTLKANAGSFLASIKHRKL
ncbi:hypothetical protein COL940_000730 [Colletotrichum noveboracense]|nr:hypothetical protein COL940_000730 [Colletotrichum noveboracense]